MTKIITKLHLYTFSNSIKHYLAHAHCSVSDKYQMRHHGGIIVQKMTWHESHQWFVPSQLQLFYGHLDFVWDYPGAGAKKVKPGR